MFDDLDRTLEELLKQELPAALVKTVSITFAAPDSQFPPAAVTLPAINLFLYDVRENRELRSTEWIVERRSNGTATRQRPAVRVDCSYLVTAWPSDAAPNPAQDEHRLLGEVMKVLLRHHVIPEVLLQGSLSGQDPPLPAITIQPSELQSWGDFWQAIGSKPKAALNYKVTIAVPTEASVETEAVVTDKRLRFLPPMAPAEKG
jgi:hypothetical protein